MDVSSHLNDLVSHGLTKFLLNDISADDWAEVIKPVGPRILIRRAAGNVYLKAELKNLQTMTEIGRGERDKAITEGSGIRGELEKSQVRRACGLRCVAGVCTRPPPLQGT